MALLYLTGGTLIYPTTSIGSVRDNEAPLIEQPIVSSRILLPCSNGRKFAHSDKFSCIHCVRFSNAATKVLDKSTRTLIGGCSNRQFNGS